MDRYHYALERLGIIEYEVAMSQANLDVGKKPYVTPLDKAKKDVSGHTR